MKKLKIRHFAIEKLSHLLVNNSSLKVNGASFFSRKLFSSTLKQQNGLKGTFLLLFYEKDTPFFPKEIHGIANFGNGAYKTPTKAPIF